MPRGYSYNSKGNRWLKLRDWTQSITLTSFIGNEQNEMNIFHFYIKCLNLANLYLKIYLQQINCCSLNRLLEVENSIIDFSFQILPGQFRALSNTTMWRSLCIESLLCHHSCGLSRIPTMFRNSCQCSCIKFEIE